MITLRTTRKNQYKYRQRNTSILDGFKGKNKFITMHNLSKNRMIRELRGGRCDSVRHHSNIRDRVKSLADKDFPYRLIKIAMIPENIKTVKRYKCNPHEHNWNNEGCNPEFCLDCGMSFIRYVHTECE